MDSLPVYVSEDVIILNILVTEKQNEYRTKLNYLTDYIQRWAYIKTKGTIMYESELYI